MPPSKKAKAASRPVPSEATRPCTFCGTPAAEVDLMIDGDEASICDICVGVCAKTVDDQMLERLVGQH